MFIFTSSIPAVGPPILLFNGTSVIMRSELEVGHSISFSTEVNPRTCAFAHPICVQDVRMHSFTFSRRLPETAVFYRVFREG